MVILIRKRQVYVLLLFLFLFCGMTIAVWQGSPEELSAIAEDSLRHSRVFVIDAGHGGEDGGAVSADGTPESGINLEISLRLRDLLHFCGMQTRMIRTADVSVNTPGLATFRERKSSDLKNRTETVNRTPNAVLVSIHQNSLPSVPSVHGAQVFYNHIDGAQPLAEQIQSSLNQTINLGNEKRTREIPDTIYLMNHTQVPAVLVECGFLSNSAETQLLKTASHQKIIATAILSGILSAGEGT